MKNAIKDMFLMGLGAARLTKKMAEDRVKVFVKKGLINKGQAKEIINKIMSEANKAKDKLKKEGEKEVGRVKRKIITKGKIAGKKLSKGINSLSRKIIRKAIKK
ncbi:MAG: hypothetical protein KAK00_01000 [Nanoarchaeota archaeon]|nr:hypothetical protein [Nanoarchaeota archaeon]